MNPIWSALLPALISISAVVGVVLLAMHRSARRCQQIYRVSSLAMAVIATGLIAATDTHADLGLRWIHGAEPIGLSLHAPGIYLAIVTFWALPTSQFIHWSEAPPDDRPSIWPGLAHILCALVAAALTVDHFVARLVLLDLVALCLLIVLFLEPSPTQREPAVVDGRLLIRRYLPFRAGDIGLLAMVLILWLESGTFLISSALQAAGTLSSARIAVALVGGLLAVAVKLGLPPFHGWLAQVAEIEPSRRSFLLGVTLPLLGAYLLYRMQPLVLGSGMSPVLAALGTVLLATTLLRGWRSRRYPTLLVAWLLSAHGSLALVLVSTPAMRGYLYTFLPLRMALMWALPQRAFALGAPRPSERALGSFGRDVPTIATLTQRVERVCLAGGVLRIARSAAYLAAWTYRRVEQGVLEGLIHLCVRWTTLLSMLVQVQHNGRLRRYLLWATTALLVLLTLTLSCQAA